MAETAIILNNSGNNIYAQTSREYLTSPIRADMMRVLLQSAAQINNIISVRNKKSVGTESNRDISLSKFVSANDRTNLIIDVPLDPPLILDGQTSFRTVINANSEITIMFYFDQKDISEILR